MSDLLADRLKEVVKRLSDWDVDAIYITDPYNRRWLSGFTGSSGQLLVSAEAAELATDSRYWEQAVGQAPHFQLFQDDRSSDSLSRLLSFVAGRRVGVEANHMTLADMQRLSKAAPEVIWQPLVQAIEPLRAVKSSEELGAVRRAAAITDQVMNRVPDILQPGMSEAEVAWLLEKGMRELGADQLAFDIIVASGPNAALPHHHPGSRQLRLGDSVVIDMGARVDGYNSDLTRTFHLGHEPDARFLEVYEVVLSAQGRALAHLRAGLSEKDGDNLAREVIEEAGYGHHFGHGLGHGIGLAVHEAPRLSSRASGEVTLATDMLVTVEPGIYLSGWGGVRIEDLVRLTATGVEIISQADKRPVIAWKA